jgi:hypothetical protein
VPQLDEHCASGAKNGVPFARNDVYHRLVEQVVSGHMFEYRLSNLLTIGWCKAKSGADQSRPRLRVPGCSRGLSPEHPSCYLPVLVTLMFLITVNGL